MGRVEPGLLAEGDRFNEAVALPEARALMREFLARGGQTRDVELAPGKLIGELGKAPR